MTTTLSSGANKGLGQETGCQPVTAGHTVYVGARDEARGRAAAGEMGARFVHGPTGTFVSANGPVAG